MTHLIAVSHHQLTPAITYFEVCFFFKLYCSIGNFGLLFPRENQQRQSRATQPTVHACWVFCYLYNSPNSYMDYRIFNVRTDVNDVCDCTRDCTGTVRESARKVDSGRKIPCRTGESNLRQRRDGPTIYELRYIPIPVEFTSISLCRYASAAGPTMVETLRAFCVEYYF